MENEKKPYSGWLFLTFYTLVFGYAMGLTISFQIFYGFLELFEKTITRAQANKLISLYSSYSYIAGIVLAILLWMFAACIKLVMENNKIRKKLI